MKKLEKQISLIRYPDSVNYDGLTKGDVHAHLPLLYHAFFHFSPQVIENTAKLNYDIAGKKDTAFVNVLYKIMREQDPNCELTLKAAQFMSKGFAERKIIFTTNVLKFVRTSHKMAGNKAGCRPKAKSNESEPGVVATPPRPRTQPSGMSARNALPTRRANPASLSMLSTAPQMHSTGRSVLGASLAPISASESLHSGSSNPHPLPKIEQMAESQILREEPLGKDGAEDELYVILMGLSDEVNKMKEERASYIEKQMDQTEKAERKIAMLETENLNLKTRLGSLELEVESLRKEISQKSSSQQETTDFENILARLDLHDMKFETLENSHRKSHPQSPVCGDNLCSNMKKLQLPNNSVADVSQTAEDTSLLDTTNESPYRQQIRQKGVKLLELVQGTRSLLGMSESLEQFKLAGTKKDGEENEPPEEEEEGINGQ